MTTADPGESASAPMCSAASPGSDADSAEIRSDPTGSGVEDEPDVGIDAEMEPWPAWRGTGPGAKLSAGAGGSALGSVPGGAPWSYAWAPLFVGEGEAVRVKYPWDFVAVPAHLQ